MQVPADFQADSNYLLINERRIEAKKFNDDASARKREARERASGHKSII